MSEGDSELRDGLRALARAEPLDERRALARLEHELFDRETDAPAIARYRLVEKIGTGGCGVVYHARDPELGRRVAIKVIRADHTGPRADAMQQRLLREARMIAAVNHPNVIEVFDVGVFGGADGQGVFIAMEYVEGGDLAGWLAERSRPPREIIKVFLAAARGLAAAHAAGMIHRDFKPSNVLVGTDGRARVLDFGLARATGGAPTDPVPPDTVDQNRLTETGTVMGTPAYMAPEQLRGEASPKSDQFSFCVALTEGLCGRRPSWCNDPNRRKNGATSAFATLKGTSVEPTRVRGVLERGLRFDPEQRYASMDALIADLRSAGGGRRYWMAAAAGAAALGVGVPWFVIAQTDECRASAKLLRWDDRRSESIPEGPRARLDQYAEDWTTAHFSACRERTESFDRRMACLAERRRRFNAFSDLLTDPNAPPGRAAELSLGLSPISTCNDAGAGSAAAPPGEGIAGEVEDIRVELARAHALNEIGDFEAAREASTAALERADAVGYPPLTAEALIRVGHSHANTSGHGAAREFFERAYSVASAAGHESVALEAALGLFVVVGMLEMDFERANIWRRHTMALIERGAGDTTQRARVLFVRGMYAMRQGDLQAARALVSESIDLQLTVVDGEPIQLAQFEMGLASLYTRDAPAESAAALRRSIAHIEESLGVDHAKLVPPLSQLARALRNIGEIEDGVAAAQRALRIADAKMPTEVFQHASAYATLGLLAMDTGHDDAALGHFGKVFELLPEQAGRMSPARAIAVMGRGRITAARGDCETARADLESVLEVLDNEKGIGLADLTATRDALERCRAH